jgi:hypothetical protein
MNAHAPDHSGSVNYGDAFTRFCRGDGTFLTSRATADHDKVVFERGHLGRLRSGNARTRSSQ